MSLRNRILITIGALIAITSLSIIYIAHRSIHYSSVSHAYSILALNKDNSIISIRTKLTQLRSYAISLMYSELQKAKIQPENGDKEKLDDPAKPSHLKQMTIYSEDYREVTRLVCDKENVCEIKRKAKNGASILFSKSTPGTGYICIKIPFKIDDKNYLALSAVDISFFHVSTSTIPSFLIVPDRFEINLARYTISDFKDAEFKNLFENPDVIKQRSGFLSAEEHFVLFDKIPQTNLRIVSYSSVDFMKATYTTFLKSSLGTMLLILLASIVVFFFLINSFLRPIRELCTTAKCFSDGLYDRKINPSNFREVNDLITSFDSMTKKIKQREKELKLLNENLEKEVEKKTRELLHAAKMASLGTLSSGISHEFNNILGAVIGHVSLALEKKDKKEMIEALEISLQASEKACSIISRLQDFVKKKPLDVKVFDIHESINNTIKLVQKDFLNSKVKILKDYSNLGIIKIKGNPSELEQVILNLFLNSKQAMPKGGEIKIKTNLEHGMVGIVISDTGLGIDPEIKDRIFEPFFTTRGVVGMGKSFGAEDTHGSGLGLSISLGIIEKYEGTINILSTSKKGTSFEIKIPAE